VLTWIAGVPVARMRKGRADCAVIEGDQQTVNDAARIRATGTPAIQVNLGVEMAAFPGVDLDRRSAGGANAGGVIDRLLVGATARALRQSSSWC
jgi:hypothetical protein